MRGIQSWQPQKRRWLVNENENENNVDRKPWRAIIMFSHFQPPQRRDLSPLYHPTMADGTTNATHTCTVIPESVINHEEQLHDLSTSVQTASNMRAIQLLGAGTFADVYLAVTPHG